MMNYCGDNFNKGDNIKEMSNDNLNGGMYRCAIDEIRLKNENLKAASPKTGFLTI